MTPKDIRENQRRLRDKIAFFSNASALRGPVYGLTNVTQQYAPEIQLLSLAASLFLLCEATGMKVSDVLTVAQNAVYDVDSPFSNQMNALKAYARGELLGEVDDAFGS